MRGEIVITKDAKSDALFLHDARKWQVLEMQILSTKYLRFDSNGLLTLKKKNPPRGVGMGYGVEIIRVAINLLLLIYPLVKLDMWQLTQAC